MLRAALARRRLKVLALRWQAQALELLGPPGLASTGVEQAKAAVAEMFGEDRHSDHAATITKDNFPVGVWTIPEMGYYGLTKEAAIKKGIDAEEGA